MSPRGKLLDKNCSPCTLLKTNTLVLDRLFIFRDSVEIEIPVLPVKFKPRSKKRGLNELPPPPTKDELAFQQYQHDYRISGKLPTINLSGDIFNRVNQDRSLKYQLSKQSLKAAEILKKS